MHGKKKISAETVRRVANISKLSLTDHEVEKFRKDLSDVLDAFRELDKVNTKDVEPSFHPIEIKDALREDEEGKCLPQEKALDNTAHKEKGFFKGPRVL